jgi:Asp-tRNA(Asn)/Glu-tRNA(Gln) amidotransferase C subunit
LTNAAPLRLSVAMQKDAPPVAGLPGLPRETAMLATDVLHIRTEASDDFGVRDLGLTWEVVTDTPLTESFTSEVKIMTPSSTVKKAAKVFLWSPRAFRIPADSTVELQGYARDFFPDRPRSRTAPYRIRILSPEEHAELVRQQLEDILAHIEEVTRLQEKIVADLHQVQDDGKLPATQKSARVGQSKDDQLQNSARLEQLSQQAQDAVQEAMKNPMFPADAIRQWSQSAQQWQQLAREKMKEAAGAMQSAQQNSPSRPQQMANATQKAEDILKALEKMQDKAGKHMDTLQALTLAGRLRKVGTQEKEIGGRLLKTASDTIGLPPGDLPEKFKQFERALTSDQGRAQKESGDLQGEISRFFERTQKTNYGAVSQEMKESRTTDELEHLGGMIGDNIAIEASGSLGRWSERFQKWGDKLEPKAEDPAGQGSGGKSQGKDLTEQLIALLRLRENEMNLRDQTTVLDQQKGEPSAFKERANSLSDTQKKLAVDLEEVHQKAALAELEAPFAQTAGAMQEVETVLQTLQTGKPADEAEIKTIDSLSDLINLINEQAHHSNPQSSPGNANNAEEMAFLLRMMQNTANAKAMAVQPATGLHNAGGTTDRAGNPVTGNAAGKSDATRNVNKASGVINNSPTEFRDALDIYFHGIEQSKD